MVPNRATHHNKIEIITSIEAPISGHSKSGDGGLGLFHTITTLCQYFNPDNLFKTSISITSRSYVGINTVNNSTG